MSVVEVVCLKPVFAGALAPEGALAVNVDVDVNVAVVFVSLDLWLK